MRRYKLKELFFVLILISTNMVLADDVLEETQALMADRQQIEALAQKDAGVKKADDFVTQVVGTGKEKDELYKISADVMGLLVKKHNGDISAMQNDLLKALKDPAAFLDTLNPEHRQKIRNLATQVEGKSNPISQPKP
jgi:hypothetical protein